MKTKRIHRGIAAVPHKSFLDRVPPERRYWLGSPPLFVPETLPQIPSRPLRWAFAMTAAAALALVVLTCARVWLPDFGFTRFINIGREFVPRGSAIYQATPKYVTPAPGPDAGFDGQWYAEIALDPLLRDPQLRHALDDPAYRADRILLPALAWLGGFGRPFWILNAYALLNPIFWFGYVALLYVLFRGHGWAGWAGFTAMLLTCGIVESMYGALTDFPAFVLMTLAAVVAGSRGAGVLGLAALTREVNLLGLAGILEFEPPWRDAFWKNVRRGAIAVDPVRALVLLCVLAAAALAGQPFARRPLLLDGRQQPRAGRSTRSTGNSARSSASSGAARSAGARGLSGAPTSTRY